MRPDQLVTEVETRSFGSSLAADADAAPRETRWLLERCGGGGTG